MILFLRVIKIVAIMVITVCAVFATAYVAGLRYNLTKSIPVGFYWATEQPVTVNVYVMFCPPAQEPFLEAKKRGYLLPGICDGQFGYMMKKVVALSGDRVAVDSSGVTVNGKRLALSRPLDVDGKGRPMPSFTLAEITLGENEVLLMSDVSRMSFDARYFGPIPQSHIKRVITPAFKESK